MQSRILLVNFQQNQVDKLKSLSVAIDTGHISDVSTDVALREGGRDEVAHFRFPRPIYEYKVVLINLHHYSTDIVAIPAILNAEQIHGEIRKDFFTFWTEK